MDGLYQLFLKMVHKEDDQGDPEANGDNEDDDYSHFLIAGIFFGCIVLLIVMVCLVIKLVKKIKKRRLEEEMKRQYSDSEINRKNNKIEK